MESAPGKTGPADPACPAVASCRPACPAVTPGGTVRHTVTHATIAPADPARHTIAR
jgi:hypothetical protein